MSKNALKITRRSILASIGATLIMPKNSAIAADKIGLLLPGHRNDGGFMQAGYSGFMRAADVDGFEYQIIDQVRPELEELRIALTKLASGGSKLIAAHGGQCDKAVAEVAADYPNTEFVVIQGSATSPNVSSVEVLQEQSAWLAGAFAALTTTTGTVGHISGIRVPPGLKGRAGYAAGVAEVDPNVKLLTTFCGEQDDSVLAREVTLAQADEGADIIFTMLNAGRTGAIEGCREAGIHQIGNVRDWHQTASDVFVASAIADVSVAMEMAISQMPSGAMASGEHIRIGLENGQAVSLAMPEGTPEDVVAKIAEYAKLIADGSISVPSEYDGLEFEM